MSDGKKAPSEWVSQRRWWDEAQLCGHCSLYRVYQFQISRIDMPQNIDIFDRAIVIRHLLLSWAILFKSCASSRQSKQSISTQGCCLHMHFFTVKYSRRPGAIMSSKVFFFDVKMMEQYPVEWGLLSWSGAGNLGLLSLARKDENKKVLCSWP